ncbi:MAG TPA: hypothetical protein VF796_27380, partial [Humisphaera sp.]
RLHLAVGGVIVLAYLGGCGWAGWRFCPLPFYLINSVPTAAKVIGAILAIAVGTGVGALWLRAAARHK